MNIKNKKIAVWEKGQDTTYVNCEFEGGDIGLLDEGKRTTVINSKAKTANRIEKSKWHGTWWGKIAIGIIIGVILILIKFAIPE
ncbi:MAG TPA: hypothetical protein P5080_02000 [Candidatus Paceibacterota bacterium]|nr:hypothetical protein [Candidatus Pacearchaeota archaeon]HRZ50638.1 hypothetical protein [Candidatus Paceibacterota bacterium]HSA36465.1 hypothetical protein [Candidatus Paceibacterota bacterium]